MKSLRKPCLSGIPGIPVHLARNETETGRERMPAEEKFKQGREKTDDDDDDDDDDDEKRATRS